MLADDRIPKESLDWRAHMREVATHLANIPSWAANVVNLETLDLTPLEGTDCMQPVGFVIEALDIWPRCG